MNVARIRGRNALVALVLAVLAAGCGSDSQVGDEGLLQFDQQEQGGAFGATTVPTTAPPVVVETTASTVATQVTPPPTAPPTTLPPEQQQVTVEVAINSGSPYFDPGVVTVLVGSKVRFVNRDTVPRSVLHDGGQFDSGPIAPGAVWIYDATVTGQFNYSDGTRPFAVGLIDVQ